MFLKIEDSSQLYAKLGDQIARQSINQFFEKVRNIVDLLEGKVIKPVDDGLICRFASAEDAVKATTLIHAASGSVEQDGHPGFRLRIGAQQGNVLEEENDVFGDTVNVAARLQDVARRGQTIISSEMVNALPEDLQKRVRQIDVTHLKGKEEEVALFEVIWESEEEVTQQVPIFLQQKVKSNLTLTFAGKQYVMTEQQKAIMLGRDSSCDFVVDTRLASRQHAVIEMRRGKFILKDQASNGTYVKTNNGRQDYLRREEFVLHDEGVISLGLSFNKATDDDLIHFKCSLSEQA